MPPDRRNNSYVKFSKGQMAVVGLLLSIMLFVAGWVIQDRLAMARVMENGSLGVAVLETKVEHIEADVQEVKVEVKDMRRDVTAIALKVGVKPSRALGVRAD